MLAQSLKTTSMEDYIPVDTILREQLSVRLRLSHGIVAIKNTSFDNLQPGETWAVAEQGRAAVAAEMVRDFLARVRGLGDGFWRACHLEA